MAKEGKQLCKKPQPVFESDRLTVTDFGNCGLKITIKDERDVSAVIIEPTKVAELTEWIVRTTGQPANAVSAKDIKHLRELLRRHAERKQLEEEQVKALQRIVDKLDLLTCNSTPTGRRSSLVNRARSRDVLFE